jgi:hypothetical protein
VHKNQIRGKRAVNHNYTLRCLQVCHATCFGFDQSHHQAWQKYLHKQNLRITWCKCSCWGGGIFIMPGDGFGKKPKHVAQYTVGQCAVHLWLTAADLYHKWMSHVTAVHTEIYRNHPAAS